MIEAQEAPKMACPTGEKWSKVNAEKCLLHYISHHGCLKAVRIATTNHHH